MTHTSTQAAKTALVTGAARRIGKAIVLQLHQQGYTIALHCHRSVSEAEALAQSLCAIRPDSARVFVCDLSQTEAFNLLVDRVLHWSSRLDVLVNNASVFVRTEIHSLHERQAQTLFTVNVLAPYALSLAAFPALQKQQGSIVNITDIHAERALRHYSVYCQSKAALWMQTVSLAREFAPFVRVNAVAPGAIAWPQAENQLSEAEKKKILAKTPLQRHGSPDDIAMAVCYFVQNTFVTGQKLHIDGGRSL